MHETGNSLAYDNQFAAAPGTYLVKFVVRDNISGRLGSLSVLAV